jgi:cytochrome c-type biogenesis protein CcmH
MRIYLTRGRTPTAAALLVITMTVLGVWAQEEDSKLARFNALSEKLVCQCGCTMVLAYCSMLNCGSATPMRAIIKEEINKGTSDEEIIAKFVRQYGQVVLAAPPAKGFNLTAWIMPFFALGAGSILAYVVAVRMKRARTAQAASAPQASGTSSAFDAQIEQELQNFEERE